MVNLMRSEPKQWIIARKDLAMPPGKLAAQVAHASMGALLQGSRNQVDDDLVNEYRIIPVDHDLNSWLNGRFTKVVLEINSEEELLNLYNAARTEGKRVSKIIDSGLTVFNGQPTLTCVGLGPHSPEDVKHLVGSLKTYR